MSIQRQDYVLRQIALLRQFIARLASQRTDRELEEALLLSFHLQEKLLPLPPAEFLRLDLDAQITALRHLEPPAAARDKCLSYAGLLAETAELYDLKGRDDLAAGARQMALYASLVVALEHPADASAIALINRLTAALDPAELHAPVAELLAEFRRPA
ncbi:hypothetical protein Verru16b_02235 [Lacunisphaera limnophila]|uniref:Uncharacterized protein n=1 Tax=Lacunisphaera limnophila TaxID=1838286 RepID=A0A1D8AW93_9BACT|nr:hypothetical protein [Lacunisphaera limnophila]AOS45159.1 hypothetical protein Verru16b_02235 [Lacunisphaera limnophila]